MPTTRSNSAPRSSAARLFMVVCAIIASAICAPIDVTGLSAFMALWKTILTRLQRKRRSVSGSMARTSCPAKRTSPPAMRAGGLSKRVTALAMVLLPQPDSPARPSTSPLRISKETPSTARTGPRPVRYSTRRSRTCSSGSPGATAAARSAASSSRAGDCRSVIGLPPSRSPAWAWRRGESARRAPACRLRYVAGGY